MRLKRLGGSAALAAILSVLASASVQAQAVYKWIDADGQVNYSDTPPTGSRAQRVHDPLSVIPGPTLPSSATQAATVPGEQAGQAVGAAPTTAPTEVDAAARRDQMIQLCEAQRGVDCAERVDGVLNGLGPSGQPGLPVIMLRHNPNGTYHANQQRPAWPAHRSANVVVSKTAETPLTANPPLATSRSFDGHWKAVSGKRMVMSR